MALFKILKGASSRIDVATTPFTEGYAYFTPDNGGFYIDAEVNGEERRIQINDTTKVPIAQGVANAGKCLLVGNDGNVIPQALPSSDLSSCVQLSQGVENAGKFLVVGDDGDVTLQTLETWQGGSY